MTLQDVVLEISEAIPQAGVIAISHCLTTSHVGEHWDGLVYLKSEDPNDIDIVIANAHMQKTPEALILALCRSADADAHRRDTEIERLKAKLARLEGK